MTTEATTVQRMLDSPSGAICRLAAFLSVAETDALYERQELTNGMYATADAPPGPVTSCRVVPVAGQAWADGPGRRPGRMERSLVGVARSYRTHRQPAFE
ncbi:hypothetical protein [Streptomyces sp. NPDC054849]